MVDRISTATFFTQGSSDIGRLQAQLGTIQQQVSSGNKFDNFVDMGNDIVRVQDLQASVSGADRYTSANDIALARLHAMDLAVQQIQDIAAQLSSNLVTENSPNGNVFDLANFARSALNRVQESLNTTQAGRSLFAGSKTDQPAVKNLIDNDNTDGNTTNAAYYNGDSFVASVQASSTLTVEYGITAGDKAFQDVIGALHAAIALDQDGGNTNRQNASDFLQSAITGLTTVRTKINNSIVTLNSTNDQHSQVKIQLNDALTKIVNADVVDASIQSAETQATLTATMQMFARISSLRLVDFLK